jgi:[ribosomal protein S5]-alanine N-acetyltransferase
MTPLAPATAPALLETERLRLRGFTDTDADAQLLFELDSDPEVMRYIGPSLGSNVEAYRQRIRTVWLPYFAPHSTCGLWALHEKVNGQFIGWCFLRPATDYKFAIEAGWTRPSDLELGYRLCRAAWGRGFATEASSLLARQALADPTVSSIVAAALVPNRASTRVMEKIGMTRIREFAIPGHDDLCVMYALRGEGDSASPNLDPSDILNAQ